jgi:hypothetical protein
MMHWDMPLTGHASPCIPCSSVEEDEEMKREDERGVAKRPDLNELDAPEWAELALDQVECRKLLQRIAL